jgi:hypothetical protein
MSPTEELGDGSFVDFAGGVVGEFPGRGNRGASRCVFFFFFFFFIFLLFLLSSFLFLLVLFF